MNNLPYFFHGFMLGLAYVAPIGVQNLFVINTALNQEFRRVYQTAFIVIFFDITLAMACFYGIGLLLDHYNLLKLGILLVGSLLIMVLGIKLILARPKLDEKTDIAIPLIKVMITACVLTWFNPQAIIDGSMILGAFKAALPIAASTAFIIGVASASCTWFLSLATIVAILKGRFSEQFLGFINVACGIVMLFYGLKLAWTFIQML